MIVKKRDDYIAAECEEADQGGDSFDRAVETALRAQILR